MTDLTPEDIALGIRAARAGWRWAVGDVVREVTADGTTSGPMLVTRTEGILALRTLEPSRQCQTGADQSALLPDPTARGFVSAALAQVRERTDRWWYVATAAGVWWLVDDQRRVLETAERHYPTEVEAVVAALEATR